MARRYSSRLIDGTYFCLGIAGAILAAEGAETNAYLFVAGVSVLAAAALSANHARKRRTQKDSQSSLPTDLPAAMRTQQREFGKRVTLLSLGSMLLVIGLAIGLDAWGAYAYVALSLIFVPGLVGGRLWLHGGRFPGRLPDDTRDPDGHS